MYGLTNASKGIQDAATIADIEDAKQQAFNYTDANKGYAAEVVTNNAISLAWNKEIRLFNITEAVTVQLPDSPNFSAENAQTCEARLILKFGSTGTPSVTFTPAIGQVIKWPDDVPTWTNGMLYEISLSPIYSDGTNMYVIAYGKEIDLTA